MLPTKVRSIGNSFGVIIPKTVLKMLDLRPGDELKIDKIRNRIILEKVVESLDKDTEDG